MCHTNVENVISQKCVPLAGKSLPHPVGVFCIIPNPPNCHIMQKSFFCVIFGIIGQFPYIPLIYEQQKTATCCTHSGVLKTHWAHGP